MAIKSSRIRCYQVLLYCFGILKIHIRDNAYFVCIATIPSVLHSNIHIAIIRAMTSVIGASAKRGVLPNMHVHVYNIFILRYLHFKNILVCWIVVLDVNKFLMYYLYLISICSQYLLFVLIVLQRIKKRERWLETSNVWLQK